MLIARLEVHIFHGFGPPSPCTLTPLGDKALSIMVVVFEFISTALMAFRCFPAVREQRRMRAAGAFQRPLLVAVFQQGISTLAVALLPTDGQVGLFYYWCDRIRVPIHG